MYDENKGFEYEKIAEKYLIDNDYKIIEKNFACRFGEIDLIVVKEDVLHFIEVKGRKNLDYGYPREAANLTKQKRIIRSAKYYFMIRGTDDFQCQFDVIEVVADNHYINHLENAFWT